MNVTFLDVPGMVRWVTARGVENIVRDLTTAIDADFARWQDFDKTPRVASHSPEGVLELMPTSDGVTYGFKYVNGHPKNPERGFQTVTAFGMLADVGNGYPLFLTEMTILTALRTAATSAMAARHLARPDSTSMAMIGCGAQAEFQALAFRAVLGINSLRIWDTDPAAMDKLERNAVRAGFDVHRASDAREACRGADIVTTCTADKANAIVLPHDAVEPGMHLNCIGGDCPGKTELDPRTVAASRVFVEYTPQTRIEGEIQRQAPDFPVTELWEVVQGRRTGRESAADVTLFDSVGFAVEDFSALRFVYDAVRADPDVATVDLVAEPADPKDLFAYATAAAVVGV
ncbi:MULTISPECIES: ornithine cyclodeaminase [unclassified Nocardioides]|jgi:ornithine cyclodeaminase|uniref:ornithine cyclodeaminase n=1 Tax=unclassified Nocardioides TaxID=2615069 RepID=UPI000702DFC1|nr:MULTISPECIES: ornithine cyclodeaminase [unclassified Nocardioides]KRC50130.1 ornithine cyclodeaminase [Nocardioides sp. Root79]KRC75597.1 ornithine cyclodeaminase [Nocardioides sp. Root240]